MTVEFANVSQVKCEVELTRNSYVQCETRERSGPIR
jgi:hypothetical protein